ncbi:MAG: hypothetical protein ACRCX8_14230 [Sarcina sp.]
MTKQEIIKRIEEDNNTNILPHQAIEAGLWCGGQGINVEDYTEYYTTRDSMYFLGILPTTHYK